MNGYCGQAIGEFHVPSDDSEQYMLLRKVEDQPSTSDIRKVHQELQNELGNSGYDTCFKDSERIMVKFKSASDACARANTQLCLSCGRYGFEHANNHSTVFVCLDARGLPTERILSMLDCCQIAYKVSIGLRRQKNNGPLIAIEFSEPLKGHSGFSLEDLVFKRAGCICELCDEEGHQIESCPGLDEERPITPPAGFMAESIERILHIITQLEGNKLTPERIGREIIDEVKKLRERFSELVRRDELMCLA